MVLLWRIPENYPDKNIGVYDKSSFDRFLLKKGQRIEQPATKPVVRFQLEEKRLREYDCLPNSAMVPLISSRLAQVLLQLCSGDIQLVPAQVVAADAEINEFAFLNVTTCVQAIDHAKSVYSLIPGTTQIMGFRQLHHHPNCLRGHHLALDCEYRSHLLASEQVASLLSSLHVKGVALIAAEEIAW